MIHRPLFVQKLRSLGYDGFGWPMVKPGSFAARRMEARFKETILRRPDIARVVDVAGRPLEGQKHAEAWGRQYRYAMMEGARRRMLDLLRKNVRRAIEGE